jgi:hypothetical protein
MARRGAGKKQLAQPILHIGVHKTATSWFQKQVYPAALSHRMADRIQVRRTLLGGGAYDFDPRAARATLGFDTGEKPLVICEEDLSGVLHSGFASTYVAKETAARLHAVAPEAQVVIFVRAQPTAALSHYQQYLREGGTASLRRYLFPETYRHLGKSRVFKFPHFRFAQLDYRGLVEHYDSLFGRPNVHVFAYEQLARNREAVLGKMEQILRLEIDRDRLSTRRVNDAYRRGLLPVARIFNLFTNRSIAYKSTLLHVPYWYPVRKHALRQLNKIPLFGRAPRAVTLFSPDILEWIQGRFWESNVWLAERTDLDLGAMGYPVIAPDRKVERPSRPPLLAWLRN